MAAKKGLTRQSIYDAALVLVEEQGYDQLGIQPLAKSLGVKAASLYNHITGIEDLREYLSGLSVRELCSAMEDAAEGKDSEEDLRAMAVAYRGFARQRPELYRAFIQSAHLKSDKIYAAKQMLGDVVAAHLSVYQLAQDELTHFSRAFRSTLHGFVALEAAGFFQQNANVNDSFALLLDGQRLLLNAISGREKPR